MLRGFGGAAPRALSTDLPKPYITRLDPFFPVFLVIRLVCGNLAGYIPRRTPPLMFNAAPLIQSPDDRKRNRTASAIGWDPPNPRGNIIS